ncbi:MAG: thiamine phosphate synthase [Caulobacteraceae bacterium]|nr:thiamine phosphate synthase [Caulobacteraceae bacterium]
MAKTAATLRRRAAGRNPPRALPAIWALTDPARTADPVALAAGLPGGAGIILRLFGAPDGEATARRVKAKSAGLPLLVGADARLAARVGADGVHLPQRLAHHARRLKQARPGWLVTAAAHDLASARRAAAFGADAVILSVVFPSRSPSAGRPMGPLRFAALTRRIGAPVYALGGVKAHNVRRLLGTGAIGIAAVDAFRT